jgi:hypothetical protein
MNTENPKDGFEHIRKMEMPKEKLISEWEKVGKGIPWVEGRMWEENKEDELRECMSRVGQSV